MEVASDVWTHLTIVAGKQIFVKRLVIYVNGEKIDSYLEETCVDGSHPNTSYSRLTLGRKSYPQVAYDEIILWERELAASDVQDLYGYYKGKYNLH